MPLLLGVREMTPFGRREQIHKFLRNDGFYLLARNPPIVQVVFISGYLSCLLEFGELEFPLYLTVSIVIFSKHGYLI